MKAVSDTERYIDADNFRKTMIKRFGCIPCLTDYSEASRYDIPLDDALNLAHTADVVPRAEVESLLDELIKEAGEIADAYKKDADKMSVSDFAKAEYRGTQIGALLVQYKIAELKKKYTEGERK